MRTTLYLHSDTDAMREEGERLGLSADAIRDNFRYALYEVAVEMEVSGDGTYRIVAVDGRELAA